MLLSITSACSKTPPVLESISLDVLSEIPINETREIKVLFNPNDIKENISWTSSNDEVATIKDGTITTKNVGKATITATTDSGIKESIDIEVYRKVEKVSLDKTNIELYVGDSIQLNATITPEDATYKEIYWTNKDDSIASVDNGLITAKASGTTTITATTKGLKTDVCTVTVKEKPIEFSGSGDKIISNINIPYGNYKATFTNNGRRNFIVKFYEDSSESYGDLLVNEIGAYNGSVIIKDGEKTAINDGMLEVKSSGSWTIKFEKISGVASNNISGKGDMVTGWFNGTGKRVVATFTNSGSSNFIVKVYDEYGDYDLLVNEIGSYNGQATFRTSASSKYYFEIVSSGNWSINWE